MTAALNSDLDDQLFFATQGADVAGSEFDPPQRPTMPVKEPKAEPSVAEWNQQRTTQDAEPRSGPSVADVLLRVYADALDDFESTRIATENRVRSLREVKGMVDTPEEARLQAIVDGIAALEHGVELELKRALRTHPLGPWIRRTIGVGEKQGARLLAAIGDPTSRRTVSQLWAYCGYHVLPVGQICREAHSAPANGDISAGLDQGRIDPQRSFVKTSGVAPTNRRGAKSNWNATARMRAFLVAESCIKQATSPYRPVYDAGRSKYADSVHSVPCVRCGPRGLPAAAGSPLSLGHQHARALRLVAKAILRDLWIEARRVTVHPEHQPREHAVPCRHCGRSTWNISARCNEHEAKQ